jgi:hypothetical protein
MEDQGKSVVEHNGTIYKDGDPNIGIKFMAQIIWLIWDPIELSEEN